jgi:hypothetical protein
MPASFAPALRPEAMACSVSLGVVLRVPDDLGQARLVARFVTGLERRERHRLGDARADVASCAVLVLAATPGAHDDGDQPECDPTPSLQHSL